VGGNRVLDNFDRQPGLVDGIIVGVNNLDFTPSRAAAEAACSAW